MSKNRLAQTLLKMSGQDNVITVHRPFVEFTNSLEAAMLLSQLLYWTPKSKMGGWVAKSDAEWMDELCLTRYGVRKGAKTLEEMGLIETKLKKFDNAPTTHYRILMDMLLSKWSHWLGLSEIEQSDYAKTDNPLSENEQSLTETTPENTSETTINSGSVFSHYENNIALLTPTSRDLIMTALEDYPDQWIIEAIDIAVSSNVRKWSYVLGILKNWNASGKDNGRKQEIKVIENEDGSFYV